MIKNFNQFIKEEFFYAGRDLLYKTDEGNSIICEINDNTMTVDSSGWWVSGNIEDAESAIITFIHNIEKSWDDFKSNHKFFRTNKELSNKILIKKIIIQGLTIRGGSRMIHKLKPEIEKVIPAIVTFTSEDYIITFSKPLEFNFEGMQGI